MSVSDSTDAVARSILPVTVHTVVFGRGQLNVAVTMCPPRGGGMVSSCSHVTVDSSPGALQSEIGPYTLSYVRQRECQEILTVGNDEPWW